MAANTVLNYLPRQSVVHKMTGTTKLAFFLLFTFASMINYNTWVLLGLMAVSLAVFRLSHIKLREGKQQKECQLCRAGQVVYHAFARYIVQNGISSHRRAPPCLPR